MKKILIIASNSFTGSHLTHYCLEKGYQVFGVSRSKEYNSVMLPYLYSGDNENFSFHQMDINKDLNKILKLSDKVKPGIIANYAAQGEVRNSWRYPDQWYETNCMGIVRLTEELRKRDYIKKYISASTPEVYGTTEDNLKESHNYFPSTPYGASKLAGDLHLFTLFKRYNFPVVFTRSANVYGIHQQLYRIIPRSIIYLKMGKKIQLHGEGKSERSFVHIRDVAEATMKVAEKGINGEIYHISPSDNQVSIFSLVKIICNMMDINFENSVELITNNYGQDSKFSISSKKIGSQLGWEPKISLEEGIQETIDWIEHNWKTISGMPLEYIHKP